MIDCPRSPLGLDKERFDSVSTFFNSSGSYVSSLDGIQSCLGMNTKTSACRDRRSTSRQPCYSMYKIIHIPNIIDIPNSGGTIFFTLEMKYLLSILYSVIKKIICSIKVMTDDRRLTTCLSEARVPT